jgi:hypothetical protein
LSSRHLRQPPTFTWGKIRVAETSSAEQRAFPVVIKLQGNRTMVVSPKRHQAAKECDMFKLPPWDTPIWRLPHELRPLYAAVDRVRDLEAAPGSSPAQIAAARRAVAVAAGDLNTAR